MSFRIHDLEGTWLSIRPTESMDTSTPQQDPQAMLTNPTNPASSTIPDLPIADGDPPNDKDDSENDTESSYQKLTPLLEIPHSHAFGSFLNHELLLSSAKQLADLPLSDFEDILVIAGKTSVEEIVTGLNRHALPEEKITHATVENLIAVGLKRVALARGERVDKVRGQLKKVQVENGVVKGRRKAKAKGKGKGKGREIDGTEEQTSSDGAREKVEFHPSGVVREEFDEEDAARVLMSLSYPRSSGQDVASFDEIEAARALLDLRKSA